MGGTYGTDCKRIDRKRCTGGCIPCGGADRRGRHLAVHPDRQGQEKLQTVKMATDEAKDAAITTVMELQQTVVDDLKAAAVDGKLTKEEISKLKNDLLSMSMTKLSDTSVKILTAAGVDISAIIAGAGEALIKKMKNESAK